MTNLISLNSFIHCRANISFEHEWVWDGTGQSRDSRPSQLFRAFMSSKKLVNLAVTKQDLLVATKKLIVASARGILEQKIKGQTSAH